MSDQRPNMLTPALIGGVLAGLLSAIPLVNCLCCLWIIGGAMLASYFLIKDTPTTLSSGDGVIVGIFTGIVAAIVYAILSIPLAPLNRKFAMKIWDSLNEFIQDMPPGFESFIEQGGTGISLLGKEKPVGYD